MNKKKLYVMTGLMIVIFICSMILNYSWQFCIYACVGIGGMFGIMHINLIKLVRNSNMYIRGLIIVGSVLIMRICGLSHGFGVIVLSVAALVSCFILRKSIDIEKQKIIMTSGLLVGMNIAAAVAMIRRNTKMIYAFLERSGDANYIYMVLERLWNNSLIWGKSAGMHELYQWLPCYTNTCILTTYTAIYGKLCGTVVVLSVVGILFKVWYDMKKASRCGQIIIAGSSIILAMELLLMVMENLMLLPFTINNAFLPFFSQKWQSVILSYILMGCIMSVYRYDYIEAENMNKIEIHTEI